MKARYFAIAAAAVLCAASLSSCTEERISTVDKPASWPKVITVNFERPTLANETRVVMGDDGHTPMWEEYYGNGGDMLSVFTLDASGNQIHCIYKCTDPSKGEFVFDDATGWIGNGSEIAADDIQGPFVVVSDGFYVPEVNMAEEEIFIDGNPDPSYRPGDIRGAMMVGYTDDLSNVTMKNIMSLFKFTVPEDMRVVYAALDVYHMNRTTYKYKESCYNWFYHSDQHTEAILLGNPYYYGNDPDDAVALDPGDYYIPFIPQDLTLYDDPLMLYYMETPVTYNVYDLPVLAKELTGLELSLEAGKIYDLGVLGEGFEPKILH